MSANSALLDELMGRNRNLAPEEMKAAEVHFDHTSVCKYFLCGFCPHELFRNTRVDIGPCDKIHEEDLVNEYKKSKKYQRMGYEDDFNRFVQSLITDIDKRIRRGEQRLGLSGGGASARDERIKWLSQKIQELHKDAEQAGCDGRVEESQRMMKQAESLNDERQQLERQALNGPPTGAGGKEMEVCPICGSFQVRNEAPAKVEEHINGRQHIGYATLRGYLKGLEEDKQKKIEEERSQVEERRKRREQEEEQRKRGEEERTSRRRRSRSRDSRRRSRSRERRRSRSRDKRRSRSRDRRRRSRERRRSRSTERRRSRERRDRRPSRSKERRRSRSRDRRRSRRSRSRDRSRERKRSRSRDRRRERSRSRDRSRRSRSRSRDRRRSRSGAKERRRSVSKSRERASKDRGSKEPPPKDREPKTEPKASSEEKQTAADAPAGVENATSGGGDAPEEQGMKQEAAQQPDSAEIKMEVNGDN